MLSAKEALSELSASLLFDPAFPRWEPDADNEDALANRQAASLKAIEMARDTCARLETLVLCLGNEKYEPAIPVLADLWRSCALVPLRVTSGHALFEIGTDAAFDTLEERLTDPDEFSVHMAIKAAFVRSPDTAFDRLSFCLSDEDPARANQILQFLDPDLMRPGWPRFDPPLIERDARWLLFCARQRDELDLARELLRLAPRDQADTAIAIAKQEEAARGLPASVRITPDGSLLRRYRAGEFSAVWAEIRDAGDIGGDFYAEVLEVADATMARVAQNADLISERLAAEGWQALVSESCDLRSYPSGQDVAVIERIEQLTQGKLPASLKAFWRCVGGINWVWDYHLPDPRPSLGVDLPLNQLDPLCVDPARVVSHLLDDWEDENQTPHPELCEPIILDLAPDHYHKANISGGSPYSICLPDRAGDPIFEFEPHRLPFVDYLRLAFDWCGFPGLETYPLDRDITDLLNRLGKKSLLPF